MLVGSIWYFTMDIALFIDENDLDWIFGCNNNRNIKFKGRWDTPEMLSLLYRNSIAPTVSSINYSVWEIEAKIRGIGNVKLIMSECIHGRRYDVTNLIESKVRDILEMYLKHRDIEAIHRTSNKES